MQLDSARQNGEIGAGEAENVPSTQASDAGAPVSRDEIQSDLMAAQRDGALENDRGDREEINMR